ncbi:MAG: HRDC domain-containing protein, partial [Acidimicrobiales bacterium]
ALAYLRIGANPDRIAAADVTEILRRPPRGLPPWFADRIRRRARWSVDALGSLASTLPGREADKVRQLAADLERVARVARSASSRQVLGLVKDGIGLGRAMGLLDGPRRGEGSSHLDDLEALEQVADLHPGTATFEGWLREVLARPGDPAGVTLSTVHRVKGMEWDNVAVFGVTAGLVPHRLAFDGEEERRVLHVAITRGRHQVVVLADESRPSPFLDEMAGRRPPAPAARPAPAPLGARDQSPPGPADERAEVALRQWRSARSRADAVPAYVVLHDTTLRALAAARPASLEQLARVDGIGPAKLERYGDDLLGVMSRLEPG